MYLAINTGMNILIICWARKVYLAILHDTCAEQSQWITTSFNSLQVSMPSIWRDSTSLGQRT